MKIYNVELNKVIESTPAMFQLLKHKGWVEVLEDDTDAAVFEVEPEKETEAELPEPIYDNDESLVKSAEYEKIKPEPEQVKTPKNPKTKKK